MQDRKRCSWIVVLLIMILFSGCGKEDSVVVTEKEVKQATLVEFTSKIGNKMLIVTELGEGVLRGEVSAGIGQ